MPESPLPASSDQSDLQGAPDPVVFQDPDYVAAVVDLLGAIAYGELSAFDRLAEDARMAPSLTDKVAMSAMAAQEFGHLDALYGRIRDLGGDPVTAMAPFEKALDDFHDHTAPADWLEGLVKAYVGDGLAADFYREVAAYLDPSTRDVITFSLADVGHADFVVDRVRGAIERDPTVAGRLALWGRRLMGEALSQAQRVAAERDELTALIAGGVDRPGMDLAGLGRMFTRLTERHIERMSLLGLDA